MRVHPKETPKCIACVLFSKYDIFAFTNCVTFSCHHPKSPSFKISKLFLACNVILLTLFTFCGVLSTTSSFHVCSNQNSICFLLISDQLIFFGNALLILLLIKRNNIQIHELASWTRLFEHSESHTVLNMFRQSDIRKIKLAKTLSFLFPMIACTFVTTYYMFSYDDFPLNFLRKPLLSFCYVFQMKRVFDLKKTVLVIGIVLKNFRTSLERGLWKNPKMGNGDDFRKYHEFVSRVNHSIGLFMETTKVVLYVWSFVAVVNLILNFFVLIKYDDYSFYTTWLLQARCGNLMFGIVTILFKTEDVVNRMVS